MFGMRDATSRNVEPLILRSGDAGPLVPLSVWRPKEAKVLAIRYSVVSAAQCLFVGFGTFMLKRIIKSLVDLDESKLNGGYTATARVKPGSRIRPSPRASRRLMQL
jgi:hypothetical protein